MKLIRHENLKVGDTAYRVRPRTADFDGTYISRAVNEVNDEEIWVYYYPQDNNDRVYVRSSCID